MRGEDGGQKTAIQPDPRGLPSLPPNLEARLPQLDQSLRITHAEWLPVTKTRCVRRLITLLEYLLPIIVHALTPIGRLSLGLENSAVRFYLAACRNQQLVFITEHYQPSIDFINYR